MRQLLFPVLFGIAAIAIGIHEYYDLLALETQGGSRKVHTVIKLLYESAGKWDVLGFFVVAGAPRQVLSYFRWKHGRVGDPPLPGLCFAYRLKAVPPKPAVAPAGRPGHENREFRRLDHKTPPD